MLSFLFWVSLSVTTLLLLAVVADTSLVRASLKGNRHADAGI